MNLLLLSNSTNYGQGFLEHAGNHIASFLGGLVKTALFIPYAAISVSFDEYTEKVRTFFNTHEIGIESIHQQANPLTAIQDASAIVVGGGNTFQLLKMLQKYQLIDEIRYRVNNKGIPYIGWSAGANITCPTIETTNDMPVAEPENFTALNLLQFQINPHYLDWKPDNFSGESRDARIKEFCIIDPEIYVLGLREGSILHIEDFDIRLIGDNPVKVFKHTDEPKEYYPGDNMDFLF